jgi:hypothetical protein
MLMVASTSQLIHRPPQWCYTVPIEPSMRVWPRLFIDYEQISTSRVQALPISIMCVSAECVNGTRWNTYSRSVFCGRSTYPRPSRWMCPWTSSSDFRASMARPFCSPSLIGSRRSCISSHSTTSTWRQWWRAHSSTWWCTYMASPA